ncbi:MAG: CopG family transcriptional regulator [Chloroflexota bacterium]|nr:MAG: CopG family transcriptional regulator [Chloroflexota bacterium]
MRMTVYVDDDVLSEARALSRRSGVSVGKVLSDLARQALKTGRQTTIRNGVPLFPNSPSAGAVTMELVNRLRG